MQILLKKDKPSLIRAQPGVLADMLSALDIGREASAELRLAAAQDPLLALGIMAAARRQAVPGQRLTLDDAVGRLSPDFLRVLILSTEVADKQHTARWVIAQRVAHLARLVAEKTRVCDSETAWLAGLCHDLPAYLGTESLPSWINAWLLAGDEQGFLSDAVHFHSAPPARLKSAHPLVRVLQLAVALACRDNALENVDVRAAMSGLGLDSAEGARLQQEAIEKAEAARLRYTDWEAVQFSGPRDRLSRAYAQFASLAALRDYLFLAADEAALARVLGEALQGFAGLERSILYVLNNQALAPARWWPVPDALREISISTEDPVSALAQAARGNRAFWLAGLMHEASVADAQIARVMKADTLLAEPLRLEDGTPAVLVAINPPHDLIEMPVWKTALRVLSSRKGGTMPRASAYMEIARQTDAAPVVVDGIPRDQVRKAVHEVANPLTIMRNYVNLLSGKFQGDTDISRDLSIIGNEIERVAGILRALTAQQKTDKEPVAATGTFVEINPVISELVRLSLGTLFVPNKVSVQIDLDPDTGPVITNRDQLKQVLLNLAKNAVEAMPQGGKLIFGTHRIEKHDKPVVEILVRDTGQGLPDEVKRNLFQPVTSSKGGDHAGLGLSICRGLVESMGGQIECESGTGGTSFRIYLPAEATTDREERPRASGPMPTEISSRGSNNAG